MKLADLSVSAFADALASDAPAPGGGSAAALEGAVGVGLTVMVAALTRGRKKYEEFAAYATQVEAEGDAMKARFLDLMDRDTQAFNAVSAAFSLPRDTGEQKAARSAAIQEGLKRCTETPLETMALCADAITLTEAFLAAGFNTSSASDLGVAFLSLKSAMQSAWLNVLINIGSIKDADYAAQARRKGEALLASALPAADKGYAKVLSMVEG